MYSEYSIPNTLFGILLPYPCVRPNDRWKTPVKNVGCPSVSERRVGTGGPRQGGQGDGHETHGRGADVRHAPEVQGEHVAPARGDAAGQGPVQVSSVVRGPADGRAADRVPGHGLPPGRRRLIPRRRRAGPDRTRLRRTAAVRSDATFRSHVIIVRFGFQPVFRPLRTEIANVKLEIVFRSV